jgi:Fe-S cluster biogenesis protein NfuA
MFIQTEAADDPRLMTFLPGRAVLTAGTAEFPDADAARRSPLARRLFDVAGVESVTLKTDAVVVERSDDADWQTLKPPILGAIMDHFTGGQPVLLDEAPAASAGASDADAETVRKIEDLIATRIRPAVRDGNGGVEYHSMSDGVLYLKLEGSAFGLMAGIQNMIRHYLPQVKAVRDYRAGLPKPGLKSAMGIAVQDLLDKRINPSVAAHGGHIALIDVDTDDRTVFLRLEGGCQGCGQADVTLKQGIETEIKKYVPEVLHVLDTTDHANGKNPYFQMR